MELSNNFYNINKRQILDEKNKNINSISGKMINPNNNIQDSYDFYEQTEKEKDKINESIDDLENDKEKLNDLLPVELMNKMTLISPIPQHNLPQKKIIHEILRQEKAKIYK